MRFHHVALVFERMTDAWPVLADALGGRCTDRGLGNGFSWMHLTYANGFVLETLHPEEDFGSADGDSPVATAAEGDRRRTFTRRFLDRNGPGPHHLTFYTDDLATSVAHLEEAGIRPGVLDRSEALWQEAIYSATGPQGTVLQVVQRDGEHVADAEPPEGFPELPYDHPMASLGRVVHAVADLDAAMAVFGTALGGEVVAKGAAVDGNHWIELAWEGVGRLRLLEARHAEIAEWVGDRTGRIRHLFFSFDEPATVPGAHMVAEGRWVVDTDDHLGVRLVLGSTVR